MTENLNLNNSITFLTLNTKLDIFLIFIGIKSQIFYPKNPIQPTDLTKEMCFDWSVSPFLMPMKSSCCKRSTLARLPLARILKWLVSKLGLVV